ncbi:hypothetical protein SteCoe_29766 [Stentor coeruleus]|uniref:Uncharacterized protein n=1 Tax=Stentor coeruleus TaxID=5963 RepID=A0A1R2B581_9CILI|nr:hypothetical protein SteCoe_29766 [Stentor coeruleus]
MFYDHCSNVLENTNQAFKPFESFNLNNWSLTLYRECIICCRNYLINFKKEISNYIALANEIDLNVQKIHSGFITLSRELKTYSIEISEYFESQCAYLEQKCKEFSEKNSIQLKKLFWHEDETCQHTSTSNILSFSCKINLNHFRILGLFTECNSKNCKSNDHFCSMLNFNAKALGKFKHLSQVILILSLSFDKHNKYFEKFINFVLTTDSSDKNLEKFENFANELNKFQLKVKKICNELHSFSNSLIKQLFCINSDSCLHINKLLLKDSTFSRLKGIIANMEQISDRLEHIVYGNINESKSELRRISILDKQYDGGYWKYWRNSSIFRFYDMKSALNYKTKIQEVIETVSNTKKALDLYSTSGYTLDEECLKENCIKIIDHFSMPKIIYPNQCLKYSYIRAKSAKDNIKRPISAFVKKESRKCLTAQTEKRINLHNLVIKPLQNSLINFKNVKKIIDQPSLKSFNNIIQDSAKSLNKNRSHSSRIYKMKGKEIYCMSFR